MTGRAQSGNRAQVTVPGARKDFLVRCAGLQVPTTPTLSTALKFPGGFLFSRAGLAEMTMNPVHSDRMLVFPIGKITVGFKMCFTMSVGEPIKARPLSRLNRQQITTQDNDAAVNAVGKIIQ